MTKSQGEFAGLLRRLSSVGVQGQSIKRVGDGFALWDSGRELSVSLSQVVSIEGTKIDKITYEEIFIVLTLANGTKLPVGELADGFSEFEEALSAFLRGFPKEWRAAVEREQLGKFVSLWVRAAA